jgi:hypothetical protein
MIMMLSRTLVFALCFTPPLVCTGLTWAQAPPEVPVVEILDPAANSTIGENPLVSVKITPPQGGKLPSDVYVGLDGPPWTKLKLRRAKENHFASRIDTRQVPNGAQNLIVVTSDRRAKASIPVTVKNEVSVFFGDLHSHCGYSDGTLLPFIAHEYARFEAKLDVFCLTDHLEYVNDVEWLDKREVAWKANENGEFVAFPGLEWTKEWGHLNIYDPKTRHWPEDPAQFYQAAADAGVVVKFNHPGDGSKTHDGLAYSEVGDRAVQLMEVRTEQEEQALVRALNNGWHIAPEGSDDTHSANWGNVRSWTGILAPALTQRNILDALARRHVYSTLDRNYQLHFTVNDAIMGDIIEDPVQQIEVFVRIGDPDPGDTTATVELLEDGQVVVTNSSGLQNWRTTLWPRPGKHYYFVRITQVDGDKVWSAPIWVTVEPSAEEPAASPAAE